MSTPYFPPLPTNLVLNIDVNSATKLLSAASTSPASPRVLQRFPTRISESHATSPASSTMLRRFLLRIRKPSRRLSLTRLALSRVLMLLPVDLPGALPLPQLAEPLRSGRMPLCRPCLTKSSPFSAVMSTCLRFLSRSQVRWGPLTRAFRLVARDLEDSIAALKPEDKETVLSTLVSKLKAQQSSNVASRGVFGNGIGGAVAGGAASGIAGNLLHRQCHLFSLFSSL